MKPTIALFIATFSIAGLAAAAPTNNPVDLEQQAFDLMQSPQLAGVQKLLEKEDLYTMPLDAAACDALAQAKPAIDLLRTAAQTPTARWPDVGDDVSPVLNSLNAPRAAVNMLDLQARYELDHGEPNQAVDDLLAAMTIGRHVGQRKLLVARLVEVGCEAAAIKVLAVMLPQLPKNIVQTLPARLAKVPATIPLKETLDAERAFGERMLTKQTAIPANATTEQKKAVDDIHAQFSDEIGPFYDAVARSEHARPEEFQKVTDDAASKAKSMLIKVIAPSIGRMRVGFASVEAQEAMLRTAIAIVNSGEAEAAKSHDPFGNGPFHYETTEKGFLLSSALKRRGDKPVSLVIGKAE